MSALIDRHGRRFSYLRLSVIDACNFHCSYCRPGQSGPGRRTSPPLRIDEISRLLGAFSRARVHKVRLTGGEPTIRRDLCGIIAAAAATPGIRTVALTTNGSLLRKRRAAWQQAGLTALNVSVDALDPARFKAITGHDRLRDVLAGIDEALADGFPTLKLNAVLLRGLNDDQLPAFFDYVRDRAVSLRFIELMRTGSNGSYFERRHYRADELETRLVDGGWQPVPRTDGAGPAREYAHADFAGRIGIVAPYSAGFCGGCNRLRVSASGELHLCLFGDSSIPLRHLLQVDEDADELLETLAQGLAAKAPGHRLHGGFTGATHSLVAIGG
jgi:cyclic pyranopterin phosphate synthase